MSTRNKKKRVRGAVLPPRPSEFRLLGHSNDDMVDAMTYALVSTARTSPLPTSDLLDRALPRPSCGLCDAEVDEVDWGRSTTGEFWEQEIHCHDERIVRRVATSVVDQVRSDPRSGAWSVPQELNLFASDDAWPNDEATAGVALDLLLERCSPPTDYAYEWSVRATAEGTCHVRLKELPLGPLDYWAPSIEAEVWPLRFQAEWPAMAEAMLRKLEEQPSYLRGSSTTTGSLADMYKRLYEGRVGAQRHGSAFMQGLLPRGRFR